MKKKELKQKLKRQKKRSACLRERLDKAEAKIIAEKIKSSRLKSELQNQTHRPPDVTRSWAAEPRSGPRRTPADSPENKKEARIAALREVCDVIRDNEPDPLAPNNVERWEDEDLGAEAVAFSDYEKLYREVESLCDQLVELDDLTFSPSPDRETGRLIIEEHVPCEGDCEFCEETARAGEDYQYEFDSTAGSVAWLNGTLDASSGVFRWVPDAVEATTPSASSAAPTNSGANQTEGEGELRARIEELERRATEFSAWLSFVAGQGKAAEIKEAFRSDTGFGPYILSDEEFMRREEVARAAVPKEEA